jgi:hypothetical protein
MNYKKIFAYSLILFFILMLTKGCGDDTVQNQTVTDPGILMTDEFGNELGGDTTDWCRGDGSGFSLNAAYPNPADSIVNIRFSLPAADTVKLFFKKSNGDTTFFMNTYLNAGIYNVRINDSTGQYANTYQRVYFSGKRFTGSQYCRLYGDIKFVP